MRTAGSIDNSATEDTIAKAMHDCKERECLPFCCSAAQCLQDWVVLRVVLPGCRSEHKIHHNTVVMTVMSAHSEGSRYSCQSNT
jgi:hypothetical protein